MEKLQQEGIIERLESLLEAAKHNEIQGFVLAVETESDWELMSAGNVSKSPNKAFEALSRIEGFMFLP